MAGKTLMSTPSPALPPSGLPGCCDRELFYYLCPSLAVMYGSGSYRFKSTSNMFMWILTIWKDLVSRWTYNVLSFPSPSALALLGSRAVHVPSSTQATYIVTQGPEAWHDLYAAWSCDLHMTQLHKPLCASVRQPLRAGQTCSMLFSCTNFLRPVHVSFSINS